MKKIQLILIITLGIFLMPSNGFACGRNKIKTEKTCCKKETASKTEKKSCCDKSDNCKKECRGKCGHFTCTAVSILQFSIINTFDIDFKNNNFSFSTKKLKFYQSETFVSSSFYSIWIIPKISLILIFTAIIMSN